MVFYVIIVYYWNDVGRNIITNECMIHSEITFRFITKMMIQKSLEFCRNFR